MTTNDENYRAQYDDIVIGAILKMGKLDEIDIHIIIEEIKKVMPVNVHYDRYFLRFEHLMGFSSNNTPKLIDDSKETKEALEKLLDPKVKEFFKDLDRVWLDRKRDELESSYRCEEFKEKLAVLLLSEDEEDYEALVRFGYKRIDWFKSLILADRYFDQHPERLEEYHIFITGKHSISKCCFDGRVALQSNIHTLEREAWLVSADLSKDEKGCSTILRDHGVAISKEFFSESLDGLLDSIMKYAALNGVLDEIKPKENFTPIEIETRKKRQLPKKISELKVLYCGGSSDATKKKIVESLGLDCEFLEDGNFNLGRNIKHRLGDYDIIIVTKNYSKALLDMEIECREQSKCTGRPLVLLAAYDELSQFEYDENGEFTANLYGESVELSYRLVGTDVSMQDAEIKTTKYKVFRKEPYRWSSLSTRIGTLGVAINLFDEQMRRQSGIGIKDTPFMTAEKLTEEYESKTAEIKQRIEKAKSEIEEFDRFARSVQMYLENRRMGYTLAVCEGLTITEETLGIRVEMSNAGRPLCAMIFAKDNPIPSIRGFSIQIASKKGRLGEFQNVAFFSKTGGETEAMISKPTEDQMLAIRALYKKVKFGIEPLNEHAEQVKKERTKRHVNRPKNQKSKKG